jgi:hypothetical protein
MRGTELARSNLGRLEEVVGVVLHDARRFLGSGLDLEGIDGVY